MPNVCFQGLPLVTSALRREIVRSVKGPGNAAILAAGQHRTTEPAKADRPHPATLRRDPFPRFIVPQPDFQ